MMVEPSVVPGLVLLAAEGLALAVVGFIVVRVALGQRDHGLALAQGLVVGLALWGLIVNFVLHVLPGLSGALAGWLIVLGLGAGLGWRARRKLWVPRRTLARFGLAAVSIFWVALASRQLLIIPDEAIHTTLSATIRAGGWPPRLSWNPDLDLAYHHGIDLLIGLLTPPMGPDLAFTTELLGAFAWTSLILQAGALLLRHGSWASALALTPLLLAAGAWTLVFGEQPTLVQVPVPTGMPSAGLRAALAETYWPAVELPWSSEQQAVPPNIWKPQFSYAYPLALATLERMGATSGPGWPRSLALAGLVGFLGLVDETVAPVVLALWSLGEAWRLWQARPAPAALRGAVTHAAAGPALAALLLAGGGGVLTGVLTESAGAGELSVAWPRDPRDRAAVTALTSAAGGLGLVGFGSLVAAIAAAILAGRNRLVLMLTAGCGVFLFAALTLRYEAAPHDLGRFDGHARNFALLALMLALSIRLGVLRPRWRYAAALGVAALVTWPTIASPARKLGLASGHGVQIANAQAGPSEFGEWYWWMGRYPLERFASDGIANWVRGHTAVDARVLSPTPHAMTVATGRLNASGFTQFLHPRPTTGPEYLDAVRHLEPAALKRLGVAYVHAPDRWASRLPARATRWLANPDFFELLIRDGDHALYRVRPAFLQLDVAPAPGSFEALRRAVAAGSSVYLSPATDPLNTFRAVAVLPHTQLLGSPDQSALHLPNLHLQADIRPAALGSQTADLVVTSARLAPSMFEPSARRPILWNDEIAVYAPDAAVAPTMAAPPRPFSVRLSDTQVTGERLSFTATLTELTGEGWTGQDWLVVPADGSPWTFPLIRPTDTPAQWFAGQAVPRAETFVHRYEYNPHTATLALRGDGNHRSALSASGDGLAPGAWVLGVRLRSDYQLVAFIPVATVVVLDSGTVLYHTYQGDLGVRPLPGPAGSSAGRF
ncbi:MAG: hypothetical protein OXG65_12015 [Chloroflexi bacterium]|nr:hypothetical protein [Chloroflexota bacterium]